MQTDMLLNARMSVLELSHIEGIIAVSGGHCIAVGRKTCEACSGQRGSKMGRRCLAGTKPHGTNVFQASKNRNPPIAHCSIYRGLRRPQIMDGVMQCQDWTSMDKLSFDTDEAPGKWENTIDPRQCKSEAWTMGVTSKNDRTCVAGCWCLNIFDINTDLDCNLEPFASSCVKRTEALWVVRSVADKFSVLTMFWHESFGAGGHCWCGCGSSSLEARCTRCISRALTAWPVDKTP